MDGPDPRLTAFRNGSRNSARSRPLRGAAYGVATLLAVTTALATGPQVAAQSASRAADVTVVADEMNRSVGTGWGTAAVGGGYTYGDPGAFSVDGSRGLIKLPAAGQSRTASLPVSSRDQTTTVSLGVTALPTSGNGVSIAALSRENAGKAYRAAVRIQPGGKTSLAVVRIDGSPSALTPIGSEVVLPFVVAAGSMVTLELSTANGSTDVAIAARAWPAGSQAPAAQISTRDSSAGRISSGGTSSLWAYTSGSSQAATVLVDNYRVVVPAATAPSSSTPPPSSSSPSPTPTSATPVPSTSPSTPPATTPSTTPPPTSSTPPAPSTTTPTTTTTTTTTTTPSPAPTVGGAPQTAPSLGGAQPLGTTNYPAPANAKFVATTGSDSAGGTQAAPLRTIGKAIALATSGQTIVLRGGIYHESVVIPSGKALTIQPYNKEVVWLDGSSVVSSWAASGNAWRVGNWTAEFDASPTYTRGAKDSTEASWGFVNPNYPMAAHPDQVWVNDVALRQVGSRAAVTEGTFYVDYGSNELFVGSNPQGKTVRASDLSKAISIRADGSKLQGFGIARFAPSVPDLGAVTVEKPRGVIDNMVFADNATTGLSLVSTDITVKNVTSTRNGLLGVHANYADRLSVTNLSATSNNLERFNSSPVSGGFKVTRTRVVSVTDSQFRSNLGLGLWMDESVYDVKIVNNKMIDNSSHGVSVELSAKAVLVGNILARNAGFGMKINDTSDVRIWNNTLINNDRPINIVQDGRRASNQSTPGHDPRQAFPDPTMTWLNGPVEVRNNIVAGTTGNCLLCVEDYSKERSAEQMKVTALGNVYQRRTTSAPTWVVVWSKGAGNPGVYTTVAAFRTATGQERVSLQLDGSEATSSTGAPTAAVQNAVATVAQPMPSELAALAGFGSGEKRLGSKLTF